MCIDTEETNFPSYTINYSCVFLFIRLWFTFVCTHMQPSSQTNPRIVCWALSYLFPNLVLFHPHNRRKRERERGRAMRYQTVLYRCRWITTVFLHLSVNFKMKAKTMNATNNYLYNYAHSQKEVIVTGFTEPSSAQNTLNNRRYKVMNTRRWFHWGWMGGGVVYTPFQPHTKLRN